jgi:hypothetical protein
MVVLVLHQQLQHPLSSTAAAVEDFPILVQQLLLEATAAVVQVAFIQVTEQTEQPILAEEQVLIQAQERLAVLESLSFATQTL